MTKINNLCIVSKKYIGKDGKEKSEWQKIGVLITRDDGKQSINLMPWFNPAGNVNEKKECWISVFENKPQTDFSNNNNLQSDIPY